MRPLYAIVLILLGSILALAQRPDDIAATSTGHSFYYRDLQAGTLKAIEELPAQIKQTRSIEFDEMIGRRLLDLEAKASNTTLKGLIASVKQKVAAPTEAEIKAAYNENISRIGPQPIEAVRDQLVSYLRAVAEQKAVTDLISQLKTKYKYAAGKDVNAVGLGGPDVVATINGQNVTGAEFEEFAKKDLYDVRADVSDLITDDIYFVVTNALVTDEAKALGIGGDELLAREITNKMTEYTDSERDELMDTLRKRLFAKYNVKILYKAQPPLVQNISVDDDPATGPVGAPVTVVMFSDFQCPACSAFHPMLKKAMASFPGKIRFVVRDYPLVSRHERAFQAARAAYAANAQGKFAEYADILYTHQDALDDESLRRYAVQLGLNAKQFDIDFTSEKSAAEVRHDMDDGDAYGVAGTPTVFVNGVAVRKYSVVGFRDAIERALNGPVK
jgi:protein-disulfide isomerase